ncbi:MAG: hypothetical protein JOZ01_09830 [Candidatus Eremiobacteraeota bacterium]|nr:hypothetical protein [Candidatus Eremiobacteraeota bacterium]
MAATREEVRADLDSIGRSIEALHHKIGAAAGVDKERLRSAVEKFKTAHKQFHDDALGCMN